MIEIMYWMIYWDKKVLKLLKYLVVSWYVDVGVLDVWVNYYLEKIFNVINYRNEGENNDRNLKIVWFKR